VIGLQRSGGLTMSRVVAGTAQSKIFGANIEVEGAQSDSNQIGGMAAMVRVSGAAPTFTYDIGAQRASADFAGSQRATEDRHITLAGQQLGAAKLTAMVSTHTMTPTTLSQGLGQTIGTSSLSASFQNGSAIEYHRFDRADLGNDHGVRGNQQSLRLRGRAVVGAYDFLGTAQSGVVSQVDTARRLFAMVSGSARRALGRDQFVSVFGELTDGQGLGQGGIGTITGGSAADLALGELTRFRLTTSVTAQRGQLSLWAGQADITVERDFHRAIVSLRGRLAQSGASSVPATNAFYIEVKTPLRLPTARRDVGGRARALVVDAETGRGVEGALVRLGEQAAVTDKGGTASFKGLETGDYHAIVEAGIAAGQLVTGGDVSVRRGERPAAFTLSVARGAKVSARLRRFEKNSNAPPNGVDSVIDVGAVSQAVVALISSRDTIWQSSDDRGRIDFGSIAPGQYTLKVVAGDIPEFTVFEKKEVELNVASGDIKEVELRLLPQTRAVEFMGTETVLIAAPAASSARPAPRPVAPNPSRQQIPQGRQNPEKNNRP
jgi:hypothetical protein